MSTLSTTNLKNPSAGSNNIVLNADGTTTVTAPSNIIKSGTVNAGGTNPFPPTGGPTVVDFTGIPSWAKRVTVMFNGVSLSGSSSILVQIGANGAAEIASYTSGSSRTAGGGATAYTSATSGFIVSAGSTTETPSGLMSLQTIGSNLWVSAHALNVPSASCTISGAGSKTLSGTLDRIRITTVNGTDAFDSGSINILWEG
jgi:hypothetical protein